MRGELDSAMWADPSVTLRPTSYFGTGLKADTFLLAVDSAVQAARQSARIPGNPDWVVFDLPAIFRSYFDGLIHAAVLRWLEPSGYFCDRRRAPVVAIAPSSFPR